MSEQSRTQSSPPLALGAISFTSPLTHPSSPPPPLQLQQRLLHLTQGKRRPMLSMVCLVLMQIKASSTRMSWSLS